MIKCIIFDLDNTLFEQLNYIKNLMNHFASLLSKKYNLDKNKTYKLLTSYWLEKGPFYGHFFDDIVEKLSLPKQEVKNFIHISHIYGPRINPYPNVLKMLTKLQKKYKLALITDGNKQIQKNKIKALKLEKYFSKIFYATGKHMKPNPKGYNTILKQLELKPEQTVCVGDNPSVDFITPNKIKMSSIRVLTGYFKNVNLDYKHEAAYTINNLSKIFQILDQLQRK